MVVLDTYDEKPISKPSRATVRVASESEGARRLSVVGKPPRKYTRLQSKDTRPVSVGITKEAPLPMVPISQYYEEPTTAPKKTGMINSYRRMSGREKCDAIARLLFPFLFILFNVVYWIYY